MSNDNFKNQTNTLTKRQARPILTLEAGFKFGYGKATLFEIPQDANPLVIREGDIWGVFGPNGCGKTTLLNIISGLLTPTYGNIIYHRIGNVGKSDSSDLIINRTTHKENKTAYLVASLFGETRRTFQVPIICQDMKLKNFVRLGKRFREFESISSWILSIINIFSHSVNNREDFYRHKNSELELLDLISKFDFDNSTILINKMSYGQQRLSTSLQALYSGAKLLVLDEPFANIHSSLIKCLQKELKKYVRGE